MTFPCTMESKIFRVPQSLDLSPANPISVIVFIMNDAGDDNEELFEFDGKTPN